MNDHNEMPGLVALTLDLAPAAAPAEQRPIIVAKDGQATTNSRDVASYFGKAHKDVLRAIKSLNCSADFTGRNFALSEYTDPTGRKLPSYDMTKDGMVFLVTGFTGAEPGRFKEKYIEAFNAMEAELRARPRVMIDFTDPKVLLGCLNHLQEQVVERDAKIAFQGEKLKKLDLIEGAQGSMCISTAAKTLGVNPLKNLFKILEAHRWIFKRPNTSDWLAHQDKICAGYLEHADHLYKDSLGQERVRSRVLVTAKGLVKIAALLTAPKH